MSNGKGSKPRPLVVDRDTYAENWERVFGDPNPRSVAECTCDVTDCGHVDIPTIRGRQRVGSG
jgi:hypothetical protein